MVDDALHSNWDLPKDAAKTCDASGMAMIHRLFRSSFAEGPALVRGVREGDRRHVEAVAGHLAMLSTALHAHHEGEDQRLWPALSERAPGCALHVTRMQKQHRDMLVQLEQMDSVLPAWRSTANATNAAAVLNALDGVNAALAVHLPDEETTIVPVMEYTITKAEITWFSQHGRKATPKGYTWPQPRIDLGRSTTAARSSFVRSCLPQCGCCGDGSANGSATDTGRLSSGHEADIRSITAR